MRLKQASLSENQWDDIIDAMKCLKKSNKSHNWDFFVDTHNKFASHHHDDSPHIDGGNTTIHSPFYWLAWHRKFVFEFEKELKAEGMRVDLPYWNWTENRKIPDHLRMELFGWMHITRAVFHDGDKLPTATDLRNAKNATTYAAFDSRMNSLHGEVHNWVGGTMATFKSPKDPLFFLNHAFVDKIWAEWQAAHPTLQFSTSILDASLAPWDNVKVRDVMSISDMGYSYG
ncbi:MAG: tyrosinase family protein [Pseudomonadota bacterium]